MADELYWDPYDWKFDWDPHPLWARMMDEAPLYYNERYDFYAMTRFQDVLSGLTDWRTFSSRRGDQLEIIRAGPVPEYEETIISQDPPVQTVYRRLLSRAFTPRAVSDLEPTIRRFTVQLLDSLRDRGTFDYVEDFGGRLPGMVIGAMLGVSDEDLEYLRHKSDETVYRESGESDAKRHYEVAAELAKYWYARVAERRKLPRDDMMSALLEAEVTDDDGVQRRLNDDEAVAYVSLLSAAGNETTAKLIGWMGSTLAQFPGERAKLAADPGLIDNAVEEILRYEPPALCLARYVMEDVELHGETVPEGSVVIFIQAATGRDPRVFENPNHLDIERKMERAISFGFGPHVCLGAPLARLQGRIALDETLARFPEWEVDWDNCDVVHTGSAVRGWSKLPLRVA